MSLFKTIAQFFNKKEEPKKEDQNFDRVYRDLLRENLNTISVDVFHYDDPLLRLNPAERREYLSYFRKIVADRKIVERLQYLINKQANMTLKNSGTRGELDTAGVMKMDGLSTFKDDVERLSVMFFKEESERVKGIMPVEVTSREALRL